MGAVFRSKDLRGGLKRIVEDATRDLSPDSRDSVFRLLDSWDGTRSNEDLKEILGPIKAEALLKSISKNKVRFTKDEQQRLEDLFKESLTFD